MTAALKAVILSLATVWIQPDGAPIYVEHFREYPGGPELRAEMLARFFEDAAAINRVDPYFLIAIAYRESGLSGDRIGDVGEGGIMQLHPRSPWARAARRACRDNPELCEWAQIFEGAKLLGWAVEHCKGNLLLAVGAYRTKGGRCVDLGNPARKVLRTYREIRPPTPGPNG